MLDHRKKTRVVLSLAVGTALFLATAESRAAAQGTIGSILGTVADSSGSFIPGATVTARNIGTAAIQSTTSDERGRKPHLPCSHSWTTSAGRALATVWH